MRLRRDGTIRSAYQILLDVQGHRAEVDGCVSCANRRMIQSEHDPDPIWSDHLRYSSNALAWVECLLASKGLSAPLVESVHLHHMGKTHHGKGDKKPTPLSRE